METTTDTTTLVTLGSLPLGEYFKLNNTPTAKVYKRGAFDRSARKYWADDCSDISNGRLLKGSRFVIVGFTY